MPDMWMDVDTAVTVPVNLLPLLDDTDFKSIEINIAYNAGGMALTWHFVTTAGVITATAVTPTTGGDYDWAEDVADKGTYKIEIPASAGASINNDTEGFGWFTGVATGVLPWRGPVIGFRAAALNNALIDGGDTLDVNVTEISGDSTAADNCELMFDGTGYAGGTAKLGVDVVAISADTTAADNCELMFDGTGYAGGTAKLQVDAVAISGDTTAADNCELMFDGTGYAGGTAKLGVDVVALSGDTTAADNAESFFDGTGYAGTNNVMPTTTTVTNAVTANVTQISGDTNAADNAELFFDGTGYAGGTTKLQVDLVSILGTVLTETAGQIAAAFKKFFDVAAPTGSVNSLPNAAPAAAGGLPTTNGTKVLQTVDLTAGQSIAASSVPNVTLANGAHGGAGTTITLQTPIVANATQIEGGDATDAIGDAVWDEALAGHAGAGTAGAALSAATAPSAATVADAVWDEALAGHAGLGSAGAALAGATAPSAATVADAVWDEALAGHAGAGSAGAALTAATAPSAATVADAVWDEALAGHLGAGSTGAGLSDLHTDVADIHTDVNAQGMAGSAAIPVVGTWGQLLDAVCRGDYQYDKTTNVETIMDHNGNVVANLTVVDGALILTKT